jgi:hypothetical protein
MGICVQADTRPSSIGNAEHELVFSFLCPELLLSMPRGDRSRDLLTQQLTYPLQYPSKLNGPSKSVSPAFLFHLLAEKRRRETCSSVTISANTNQLPLCFPSYWQSTHTTISQIISPVYRYTHRSTRPSLQSRVRLCFSVPTYTRTNITHTHYILTLTMCKLSYKTQCNWAEHRTSQQLQSWDFKFSRRRVWCSELSSGIYCV